MPEPVAAAPARIAVLVSGQGRNLQALIEACAAGHIHGQIVGVISHRAGVPALQRAALASLPCFTVPHTAYADRAAFDAALQSQLEALQPDIVVLAGFMRVLGAGFVQRFEGRLINVHPSLLPKYPGLHTHQRALDAGEVEHGATVHFVSAELDGGAAIIQGGVRVEAQDTAQSLAERVMQEVEIRILPQAVAWMARGVLKQVQGGVELFGRVRSQACTLDDVEEAF